MCDNSALDLRVCSWDTLESSMLSSPHRSTSATYGLFQIKKTQTLPETLGLISTLRFSKPLSGTSAHYPGFERKALTGLAGRHLPGHDTGAPGGQLQSPTGTRALRCPPCSVGHLTYHTQRHLLRGSPSSRRILRVHCGASWINIKDF